jgi:acyl phosphate:glycerol-3-phosphate acyltransferase
MLVSAVFILAAYLIGCISFAIFASWLFRLPDPRTYGSGNPGATNVLRSGKKAAALLTLLGDIAKGWVAVMLAARLAPTFGLGSATIAACGLAAFLGHLYPVYFGFKGGKGVATALGVLLGFSVWLAVLSLAVFGIVLVVSRYVSLASVAAALAAAVLAVVLFGWSDYATAVIVLVAFVIWRHRSNLERLAAGTESKLASRRAAMPPSDPAA